MLAANSSGVICSADHPDVSTSYSIPGTYIVTHLVTDNLGGQSGCQTTIIAQ